MNSVRALNVKHLGVSEPIQAVLEKAGGFLVLLRAIVERDLKARYRRSLLGPFWAILQPIILMIVFTIIRGFITIPSDGLHYALFTYVALVPWQLLSSGVNRAGPSIVSNRSVIKKMAMPREVFPLAAISTALFDMLISGVVLAGMLAYFRIPVGLSLIWLPVLILLTALLALAVGLIISAIGTFKSDLIIATPFLIQVWLFATPIIYPISVVPETLRPYYMLNPAVGIIEGFRDVLLKAQDPDLRLLGVSALVTLIGLSIAWPLFRKLSQYFADII